jgi:hypothetical protein
MTQIFKDEKNQKQFEEDGFLKITLLSIKNIDQLKVLFKKYFPNPSADFYSSSYDNNYQLKKEISDEIGKIILPNLENIFLNYSWFGSAFLSKGNGPRSEMPMHQDWTIVDESKYIALNIWTPLQDTSEENGTLEVIKGSHLWHQSLRAPTLPFYFNGFQELLKKKLVIIPTLATEAIVLNQAIIHYSKANKTNDTRIAITTGIKSKNAPMLFHYWNKNTPNVIEQFKQEDDFLIRFNDFHKSIFERPTLGESIGLNPFKMPLITETEVEKLLGNIESSKINISIVQKIQQWIKL